MKKNIFLLLLLPMLLFGQKPKLVVGVVIDQMRYEMLERFSSTLGDDGFKKLQKEGFSFNNCNYNYIPTYTGPGHATIFSGQNPRKHGIIANDWYDRKNNTMVYCVEDNSVKTVGNNTKRGNRSPKNYKSPSVADFINKSSKSKAFGVSVKDRGAILPAGKKANGAFWMDETADFISSTYYGEKLPEWLIAFNAEKRADLYAQNDWKLSLQLEEYVKSDDDLRTVEEKPFVKKSVFPYNLKIAVEKRGPGIIKYTPYGNTIITDVALTLLINEELGKDDHTDFLSISYSSTDYAGHAFGPRSVEIQDMYIKLDLEIARLIHYLDSEMGKGEYVLFLTSDHGVVDCPGTKTNPAEYVIRTDLKNSIDSISLAEFGVDLVGKVSNFQIWFDIDLIKERSLQLEDVAAIIVEKLKSYKEGKFITKIWTRNELLDCEQPTCEQFKRTYTSNLSGDVFFMTAENYLINSNQEGTSHGTGYSYDTHVPLFFYGMNVLPGNSHQNIVVQDIVPTLIGLIKLKTDAKFDGESRLNLMD